MHLVVLELARIEVGGVELKMELNLPYLLLVIIFDVEGCKEVNPPLFGIFPPRLCLNAAVSFHGGIRDTR